MRYLLLLLPLCLLAGCGDAAPLAPLPAEAASAAGTDSTYDLTIRYLGEVPEGLRRSVERAAAQFQRAITADVPDALVSEPAGGCWASAPAIRERVDDLLVFVEVVPFSGERYAGYTSVCSTRTTSRLPLVARIEINRAELDRMEREGWMDALVTHEMVHALGMTTAIITPRGLVDRSRRADPVFTGAAARRAFARAGILDSGAQAVPLDVQGGEVSAHWRGTVLGNDVLAPSVTPASVVTSVTLGALEDLGYAIDYQVAAPLRLSAAGAHGASMHAVAPGVGLSR